LKEILTNTIHEAKYTIFVGGVATDATGSVLVSVLKNGTEIVSDATAVHGVLGEYKYILPPTITVGSDQIAVTAEETDLELVWSFTVSTYAITAIEKYSVATPYAYWIDFKDSATYTDFIQCERVARFIIHAYCGQTFGIKEATYPIEGHGASSLLLTSRIIEVDSVASVNSTPPRPGEVVGFSNVMPWEIIADGWAIRQQPQHTKLDPVNKYAIKFRRNKIYDVTGVWGHESVPIAIQEAAKILVSDLLCADHKYRDKYLDNIKMGDWRLQFASKAFSGTGNVLADQLLKDYRLDPGIGLI
jgi:hypothetical protein